MKTREELRGEIIKWSAREAWRWCIAPSAYLEGGPLDKEVFAVPYDVRGHSILYIEARNGGPPLRYERQDKRIARAENWPDLPVYKYVGIYLG